MSNPASPLKTHNWHFTLLAKILFAIGPMLGTGIFLLPGLLYAMVGPAGILSYLCAGLLLVPSLMSKSELASAMPRAGGTYYFLDRSMGPLVGSISGFGTWLSLVFKSGFEVIGLGAYLVLFLELPAKPVAVALTVVLGVVHITGLKNFGKLQSILLSIVFGILSYFLISGLFHVDSVNYSPFLRNGNDSFLASIGLVFVGFAGLSNTIGGAGDRQDLDGDNPRVMISVLVISLIINVLVMLVLIGTMPPHILSGILTPLTEAASIFSGDAGKIMLAAAAIIALVTSSGRGVAEASRYPFIMSRDKLVSPAFRKTGGFHTPVNSILFTIGVIVFFILFLSPEGIARIAAALKLMIFGLINLAVIALRESKIESYDPSFSSKWYPWLQVIGILAPIILIPFLGPIPMFLSGGVIIFGALWFFLYAKSRVDRGGALVQLFQRLGKTAEPMLDRELRQILREKGLRKEDTLEESILTASIFQCGKNESFDDILLRGSEALASQLNIEREAVYEALSQSNQIGETPVSKYLALPHARLEGIEKHCLAIIQCPEGFQIEDAEEVVYALFILISPRHDPGQHLRFLAELANRSEGIDFSGKWRTLTDEDEIRNLFIRSGEVSEIHVDKTSLAGKQIREIQMHPSCLIALIRRGDDVIIPHGDTELISGDVLTVVGDEKAVEAMKNQYDLLNQSNFSAGNKL